MADNGGVNINYTQEELDRIARIDKLDSNQKNKKLLLAGVTAALIMIFVLGTVFGAKYVLSYEGTEALPEEEVIYDSTGEDEESIIEELLQLEKDTQQYDRIKMDKNIWFNIDTGSLTSDNDAVVTYLKYVRDHVNDDIQKIYRENEYAGTYGDDFSVHIPALLIKAKDCTSVAYRYKETAEDDDGDDLSVRLVEIAFPHEDSEDYEELFGLDTAVDMIAMLKDKYKDVAVVDNGTASLTALQLTANEKQTEDGLILQNFTTEKKYHVDMTVTFVNEYAELGTASLSFDVGMSTRYSFTRAGFRFNDDIVYIAKGDTGEFKYTLVTDESPADVVLTFVSADAERLPIDKYNYYKGTVVSDTPITVTGSYTYNGVTYTDTVDILVREELENVKLSTKEMTLAVGESADITMTFKPENATVKEVVWFTEDESVAVVDEDGTVTAVGVGMAKVYCISIDGNYKRGCTVTVNEE